MRKMTSYFFIAAIAVVMSMVFIQCTDNAQKFVEDMVADINKEVPNQLDQFTRLDNSEALPNHTMRYNYTILFSSSVQMDSSEFSANMKPQLVYNLQRSVIFKSIKEAAITFIHSYKDENGKPFGHITISPVDYSRLVDAPKPFDLNSLDDGSVDNALQKMVEGMKSQLPIDIKEQNLSIIDCKVIPNNTLEYTYKLHKESISGFDSVAYKKMAYDRAIETFRLNTSIKSMATKGVSLQYIYLDKDGKYLCSVLLPSDSLR